MGLLQEMFSYPFLVRAMIGGICISLCASLLGVSLVLKRYSMIGDGLSHVSFGALSIAVAFNWAPLAVSIPVVAAAAVLLLRITGNGNPVALLIAPTNVMTTIMRNSGLMDNQQI